MICTGRTGSSIVLVIFCPPSLLLRTSASVLLAAGLAEAGDAWRFFFLPLCCLGFLLLHFPVLVLPRQGMRKRGMPNLGMPNRGMRELGISKVDFPRSALATVGSPKLSLQVLAHMTSEGTSYQHLTNLASLVGAGIPSWQRPLLELLIHITIQALELSLG
jgi:hypothetical protein